METLFASPERIDGKALTAEIQAVSKNQVVTGLLHSVSGLLVILNEHRQIIAINDSFLDLLGIDDPGQAFGLRPGEVLQCIHANDTPAGCGTTGYCSSCGAAVAIVSSLGHDIPFERICALSANRGASVVDMAFLVRSQPIKIEDKKFILLFLQDITKQEQRAALERTFYHDINNMLSVLVQTSDLLVESNPSELSQTIHQSALRLLTEVAIQRCLSESSIDSYQPMWDKYTTETIFMELRTFFANHPAAKGKRIEFADIDSKITVKTDISLVLRVLFNMIINALEATDANGVVRVWSEHKEDLLSYCVWNSQQISPEITNRIFQRNFSTKAQAGRGVGTYSMKLFGEKILGGEVSFSSSEEKGTVFKFTQRLY